MALTIYRSTDSGAPSLTYAAGSFIAMLDACLRTGYGSKAGAGWTKPFTGANIAVFRQGTGGNGRYIRVWNARTGDDPATYCMTANVRGYEAMTAVSTGTNPFPTTAQSNRNGLMVRVAHSSPSYPTGWIVRATSNWFDVLVFTGYAAPRGAASAPVADSYLSFGAFPSLKSGDTYNDFILADPNNEHHYYQHVGVSPPTYSAYVSRNDLGVVGSKVAALVPLSPCNESYMGTGNPSYFPYPNRVNNSVDLYQYALFSEGYFRGVLPGVWGSAHGLTAIGFGNTFSGIAPVAGRTFEIIPISAAGPDMGMIFETSDTFTGL